MINQVLYKDIEEILNDNNINWSDFDKATIFVTGATGLIGSLLLKSLLAYKKNNKTKTKLVAFVRNINKAKEYFGDNEIEFVTGDIREPIKYLKNINYIFHCASVTASKYMITYPVETILTSVEGTNNILELAKEKQAKSLVYVSSMEVYGITQDSDNPITEEKLGYIDITNVRSSYSEGKRICELLCNSYFEEYGINVKIARLAMTFGPGIALTDNRMPIQFAKSAIKNEDIVLHTKGDSISNFCYTSDAIRGLLTILQKGESGKSYNVCNDSETRPVIDIAKLVAKEISNNKIEVTINIPKTNIFGFAPKTVVHLCSDRLRSLGWFPQVSMKKAFQNLITYLEKQQ